MGAARTPWTEDLLGFKVVPVPLGGLDARSSARLLLRRARRPLIEADFVLGEVSCDPGGQDSQKLLEEQLARHPVLIETKGNPDKIRRLAEQITDQLPSLYN